MKRTCKRLLSLVLALLLLSAVSVFAASAVEFETTVVGDVDLDGILTVIDVTFIQRHLAGMIDFSDFQKAVGDVNGDGVTNIADATTIQRKLAVLACDFPVEEILPLQSANPTVKWSIPTGYAPAGTPVSFTVSSESIFRPVEYKFEVGTDEDGYDLVQDWSESGVLLYAFPSAGDWTIIISMQNSIGESIAFKLGYTVIESTEVKSAAQMEKELFDLINDYRVANGSSALTWDAELSRIAEIKVQDMLDNNYRDHESPTYGSPSEMLTYFGYEYYRMGENIATGAFSSEVALNTWIKSVKHNENMLDENYTNAGIGYIPVSGVWVLLLSASK